MDISTFDEIEFLRGHFSSLSYVDRNTAQELHVSRLRTKFVHAGIENKLRFSIKTLDLIREIQSLGHGYWCATPLRAVSIGDFSILISSLSTIDVKKR
jgi:hypothetical protein